MARLVVFDLDGTIVIEPDFYREVYSGTLNELMKDKRGEEGIKVLRHCRENYNGKGELALFALNIPFREWAQRLAVASLNLITPQPTLVEQMRKVDACKVIYTGSPVEMAQRILACLGFAPQDFDYIVGWKEPELFPLKWSCSPLVFESILLRFQCSPQDAWAVGDDWDTDLKPARAIGMRTAKICKKGGCADQEFVTLAAFLNHVTGGKGNE